MIGALRHIASGTTLAVLVLLWSAPIVWHLATHLPGAGLGDNTLFLWNFWWMRTALATGHDFFHTDYLFAPVGVDLTLHTSTPLSAFVGATLLGRVPPLMALNVMTLAALVLNAICAYALAWRTTRDRGAALLAGIVFGGSSYIAAHLNGHFNLTTAWTIPLFGLAAQEALRGSTKWAVAAGVVMAVTAYIDYYYVVYETVFAVCVFAFVACNWCVTVRATPPYPRWVFALLGVALLSDFAIIALIRASGGTDIHLGRARVGLHDTYNPRQVLWLLLALALWMQVRPRVSVQRQQAFERQLVRMAAILSTFLIVASPIVWHGALLWLHHDYVTQQYFWRSAPAGIDVATVLLGNPFNSLWGSAVRDIYRALGIDLIEWGAWLGLVPVVLAVMAIRWKGSDWSVRFWLAVGAVFGVWALGPHVRAFGWDTGMLMPGILLRYVPLVSNARIPGRAMIMVHLATAILVAIAATEYRRRATRPVLGLCVMATLIFLDGVPAPFPLMRVACPSIYLTLRDRPERGAVAELPIGIRDGFGEISPVDHRMLTCQTIHERPLVGGVVARLPPSVVPAYLSDPVIAEWLRLSSARLRFDSRQEHLTPDATMARLAADHIAFIMINRRTASSELQRYVEHSLPVEPIAQDDELSLYAIRSANTALAPEKGP
jgi:hypothetical protein